jgi:hypothetical protein
MIAKPVVTVLGAFTLSACVAGAIPGNPQGYAGIAKAEVAFCESRDPAKNRYVCSARVIDGKERENVELVVNLPLRGTVRYTAVGVKAFDGQRARAAVESAISSDIRQAFPGIVDTVTKALVATFGG